MKEVKTERLLLRQLEERDFEFYAEYFADEATARYVGGRCDRDTAWRRMATLIGHWELRGYGYWAVEERETGKFVGCVGLWFSEGWPELELGYWLRPEMQGRGYAVEAARESRAYAFEVVGADTLVSYIHPDNEPSKRVAERLGAQLEEVIELLDHGPHCVYRYPRSNDSVGAEHSA
ncbi:MAG: GNAT family N-acetyltransferase [Gemmatimonadota bacterium]